MNFKGKTVEQAIENALNSLGVSKDELDIKIIQEPSKGILGIGQKEAKIEVSLKETPIEAIIEDLVGAKPDLETLTNEIEQSPEKKKKIDKATAFLKEMINTLGYQVEYFIREEQNFVIINLKGKNAGKLIGKRGETLYAIQYIVNIVANRNDDTNLKFLVDIEDFRMQREKTLTNLANKLARQVKVEGKSVSLEPMNPLERKIIHMALQKDDSIVTTSEGEEGHRHIVISLKAQD
ncbi:MAG: protein jag [Firmicutes bacterium]|nr:protein jag [Bacillota bacterium]